MNIPHLTVYFDPERHEQDGMGFCCDHDEADVDGKRCGGNIGARFESPEELGKYVSEKVKFLSCLEGNKDVHIESQIQRAKSMKRNSNLAVVEVDEEPFGRRITLYKEEDTHGDEFEAFRGEVLAIVYLDNSVDLF